LARPPDDAGLLEIYWGLTRVTQTQLDPQGLLQVSTWNVDALHSQFFVSVLHMAFVPLRAKFPRISGRLEIDREDLLRSSFALEVDARSVLTGWPPQEDFMRSEPWLDAENHPTITFRATGIEAQGGNRYLLRGDLTIKGNTRSIEAPVEFHGVHPDGWGLRAGFTSRFSVPRADFGITWNRVFDWGGMAGDDLDVSLDIELAHADESLAVKPKA
jgi:polyisoprenoid-binding protein YceI